MQTIKQTTLTIIICLTVGAGVSLVSAWTGPTSSPPNGNTPAPINISATEQIKSGPLQVNGFRNLGTSIFDGNVGIGTMGPGDKLDIEDSKNEATTVGIRNKQTGDSAESRIYVQGASGEGGGTFTYYNKDYSIAGRSHLADRVAASGDSFTGGLTLLSTAPNGDMRFFTGGNQSTNERMRIDAKGNVGIGTTNPHAGLEIALGTPWTTATWARTLISGAIQFGYGINSSETRYGIGRSSDGFFHIFRTKVDDTSQPYDLGIVMASNGNVGIGASPEQKLDVAGNVRATDVCTTAGKCLSAAGGGSLSCVNVQAVGSPYSNASVSCSSGYTMTGGGCSGGVDRIGSKPNNSNGWDCFQEQGDPWYGLVTAYARCCKIQ